MYTEDDDKVKVKKKNSSGDINDFYTLFNEDEEDNSKKKNGKKEKNKNFARREVKEETDYSDFYGKEDYEEENINTASSNISTYIKIGVIVLLVIALIVLIIVLLGGKKVKGDIELTSNEMNITVGSSDYISYKIVDTESEVISTFTSSDSSVAMVDENGKVMAIGDGEAIITIKYAIDGKEREKTIKVIVTGGGSVDQKLTLDITFDNGNNNEWTNKDVTITVKANSIFGVNTIKYATNCDNNCNYITMSGNQITISNDGETRVKILATDNKKQEVSKEVIVKIDREPPTVTYSGNKNVTGDNSVEVCATCDDSVSGCKESRVCKKYTSSASNQVITGYDKAGNKNSSSSFNVTVNKKGDPCKLSVSNDGTVTATLREEAVYYGFNSSYSGPNEKSKKLDIKMTLKEDPNVIKYSGAHVVSYYVKNKNGSGGICVATVIKECECTDKSSKDVNCPLTCTYRIN